jgi:hypothetical protein
MADFEVVDIEINHYSDNWGPFVFHVPSATSQTANDGLIPFSSVLSSVTVRAFVGVIKSGDLLSKYVEVTTLVIDQDIPTAIEDNLIKAYFTYPGASYKGKRLTIVFEAALDTGAEQAFFFNSVVVN